MNIIIRQLKQTVIDKKQELTIRKLEFISEPFYQLQALYWINFKHLSLLIF